MVDTSVKSYKGLPGWSKGALAVGGLVIVGFITYSIYRGIRRKKDEADARKASQEAKKEIEDLKRKGVNLSYGLTQYEVFVQSLVQAMDECGTDEDAVYTVFNAMKNKADVLKLVEVFDVRYYQPCKLTDPITWVRWNFNNKIYGGALSTWLTYDLTNSERGKINSILSKKGIDYTF
jgi:hypothetical protein